MRKLLLVATALVGLAMPALARTVEQQVLEKLASQGYVILEQGYTFLGRLRIVAENGMFHREIVVNPGTGEILRDYAVTLPHKSSTAFAEQSPAVSDVPPDAQPPRSFTASVGLGDDGGRIAGDATDTAEISAIVEENAAPPDVSDSFTDSFTDSFNDVFQISEDYLGTDTSPIELVLPESILQMDAEAP